MKYVQVFTYNNTTTKSSFQLITSMEELNVLVEDMKKAISEWDPQVPFEFEDVANEPLQDKIVCPSAPVKKAERRPLDYNNLVSTQHSGRRLTLDISPRCKIISTTGQGCKCDAAKYGRCKYHYGLWKKKNPFVGHP